jgi:CPA1 family monovalent cation:H+ antiporter
LTVIAVRLLWVYPAAWLPRLAGRSHAPAFGLGSLTVIGWAGMRGVVSLAAALSLPRLTASGEPFPYRDLITFLVFCVILSTLVLQSLTLPALIRRLNLSVHQEKSEAQEEAEARVESLDAAIDYLSEVPGMGEQDLNDLEHLRGLFERQRAHAVARLGAAEDRAEHITVCRRLYDGALTARRRRLIEASRPAGDRSGGGSPGGPPNPQRR